MEFLVDARNVIKLMHSLSSQGRKVEKAGTSAKYVVGAVAVVAGCYVVRQAWLTWQSWGVGQTPEILEYDPQVLATDCLENGQPGGGEHQVVMRRPGPHGECAGGRVEAHLPSAVPVVTDTAMVEYQGPPEPQVNAALPEAHGAQVTMIVGDRVEVREHRRIRQGFETAYYACIVREVRSRFGTMQATDANVKTVRRFVNNICMQHGLRATDRHVVVAFAIATMDLPTESELACELDVLRYRRYRHGWFRRLRRSLLGY